MSNNNGRPAVAPALLAPEQLAVCRGVRSVEQRFLHECNVWSKAVEQVSPGVTMGLSVSDEWRRASHVPRHDLHEMFAPAYRPTDGTRSDLGPRVDIRDTGRLTLLALRRDFGGRGDGCRFPRSTLACRARLRSRASPLPRYRSLAPRRSSLPRSGRLAAGCPTLASGCCLRASCSTLASCRRLPSCRFPLTSHRRLLCCRCCHGVGVYRHVVMSSNRKDFRPSPAVSLPPGVVPSSAWPRATACRIGTPERRRDVLGESQSCR